MNASEMLRLVDSISRDRNVDKETLFQDLEQAMVSAARKYFNALDTEEFICELDRLTGKLTLYHNGEEVPLEKLGRIPAQTAKQVMIQRFREDERTSIYNEFIDRVGELVTGMAQRYEGGALVVQIGRAEGFMPRSEQIPGEQHQPGERVRCLILDVRDAGNQVKIVLSRGAPEMIRRLFEVEVPEVAERIIEIRAMAREPGHRTKIAVASVDAKVDAVGTCVGVRGSRIKNIVDELGGEKIDIVRWNESSQILIQNSLKPAEVVEISLCFELGRATVVVNEDQLSLAIGKRGQNVRLAARLTNWDVDILTPVEFTKSLDIVEQTLREIEGVGDEHIDRLAALGVISVFDVEEVGAPYLAEQIEIDPELAQAIVAAASEKAKVVAEQQQKEKEEAERRRAQEAAGGGQAAAGEATEAERQAAAVLGEAPPPAPAPASADTISHDQQAAADAAGEHLSTTGAGGPGSGDDIVNMLESGGYRGKPDAADEEPAPESPDANPSGSAPDRVEEAASQQQGGSAEMLGDKTPPEAGAAFEQAYAQKEQSAGSEASQPTQDQIASDESETDQVLEEADQTAEDRQQSSHSQ